MMTVDGERDPTTRPPAPPPHYVVLLEYQSLRKRVVNEITDSLEIDMYNRKLAFKFLGIFTA